MVISVNISKFISISSTLFRFLSDLTNSVLLLQWPMDQKFLPIWPSSHLFLINLFTRQSIFRTFSPISAILQNIIISLPFCEFPVVLLSNSKFPPKVCRVFSIYCFAFWQTPASKISNFLNNCTKLWTQIYWLTYQLQTTISKNYKWIESLPFKRFIKLVQICHWNVLQLLKSSTVGF